MEGPKQQQRGRYGDGSIVQRKDGRWEGRYYADGKRRSVYGAKKSEVRQKLKEAQRKAERGEVVAPARLTVEQYLLSWFATHRLEIRESSARQYEYKLHAHLIPAFGSIQLQKLRSEHIQRFVTGLLDAELEPSTIRMIMAILTTACDAAVKKKLLALNPCTVVTLPRLARKEKAVLTAEEAQTLMQVAQSDSVLFGPVTLALATGMRCGEILGLKWADIDFEGERLTVVRTLVHINGKGYYLTEPKSGAGRRVIPLADFAADALKRHRQTQREARMAALTWPHPEMVFTGPKGAYVSYQTVAWRFARLLAQAGCSDVVTFHSLRHSAATLLLFMGVPPHVVQMILGHAHIATTLGLYGHVIKGQSEDAIERLQSLLSAPKKEAK